MLTKISVPQINAALIEQLNFLEKTFVAKSEPIKQWFHEQWQATPPPIYGSVDLRNAGFKIAPIDMNLFPAGFNNLNSAFLPLSVAAAKKAILRIAPNAKNILVIPENHTRNLFYWESTLILQTILEEAGFQVKFGMLDHENSNTREIVLPSGGKVSVAPLVRDNDHLSLPNFTPDIVLLNNDLSGGIPPVLQNLKQNLIPPAELGWSQRLKSDHFQYYAIVAKEFAAKIGFDPWLVSPLFRQCGPIDFMQQDGLACLVSNAEALFEEVKKKYAEYHIPHQPFLIVKADAGTYGMAVMTVRDIDELRNMNRKQRTRMSTIKDGQPVRHVIIQEGIYTFETIGPTEAVAEPVVYLWGECVVGGFYRVHTDRGVDENLNAPGMHFESLAFPQSCQEPCKETKRDTLQNRFYVYGVIAQLSMLAAAREIKG